MASNVPSRNFIFTINNPEPLGQPGGSHHVDSFSDSADQHDGAPGQQPPYSGICNAECGRYLRFPPLVRGLVYQVERGDSGTTHLQGYLELSNPARITQLKAWGGNWSRGHFEVRQGTRAQAAQYCSKDDSRHHPEGDGSGGPWHYPDAEFFAGYVSPLPLLTFDPHDFEEVPFVLHVEEEVDQVVPTPVVNDFVAEQLPSHSSLELFAYETSPIEQYVADEDEEDLPPPPTWTGIPLRQYGSFM